MEHQKFVNLLGSTSDKVPRLITKKWIEVYDQSGGTCNTNKQIRFKAPMLRSDLCDYNDAYIVLTDLNKNAYDEKLALKNNAPFISCISKNNNVFIDNSENLDVVMPMYNLIE